MQNVLNPIKSYKLKLPSIELAISEWGDITGTPVIALHGWLDNMASYYPLVSDLNWLIDNKLRLITIDWPGHGHSDHRHLSHGYHLLEYVQDLHDLIAALKFDTVNIVAHSMGAAVATLYAGSFPDKVDKLMLIESIGPLTQDEQEGPEQLAKSISQRSRHRLTKKSQFKDLAPMIQARKKGTELSEKNVTLLINRNMRETDNGYQWRSDPRLRLPSQMMLTSSQSQAFIENLTMPVVLLYGEDGFVKKYPILSRAVSKHDHIIKIALKGGHHLHMEFPEQIRSEIVKLIKE